MELSLTYQDYDITYATVLEYNKDYWYQEIIITNNDNKIDKGDAVVSENGFVGKVDEVYNDYAKVKLVTYLNNNITAKLKTSNGERQGLINYYENNYLVMTGINKEDKIEKGEVVMTTGLGMLPKNIRIGTVIEISFDVYETSQKIYIEPNQDIYNLNYVMVLSLKL